MNTTSALKEKAYNHMRKLILDGVLEEGKVYSERQFSTELGISRTPYHSALMELESEGYVDILPSRGFQIHELNKADIDETYEIRASIEFFCLYTLTRDYQAGLAAAKKVVAQLEDSLKKQKEVAETTGDLDRFLKVDVAFHETIVGYTKNAVLRQNFQARMYKIRKLARTSLEHEGRMAQTLAEHQAIYDAVLSGSYNDLVESTMTHFHVPRHINLSDLK